MESSSCSRRYSVVVEVQGQELQNSGSGVRPGTEVCYLGNWLWHLKKFDPPQRLKFPYVQNDGFLYLSSIVSSQQCLTQHSINDSFSITFIITAFPLYFKCSKQVVLKGWALDQQHLGTCQKCKVLGLIPALLNQKLLSGRMEEGMPSSLIDSPR